MKTKSNVAAYFDAPAMNQHAIASQFKQFRTEVADAIRAKKGTTDPIKLQDFSKEIMNLEDGSSSSGEENNIEYFAYDKGIAAGLAMYAQYVKIEAMEGALKAVMPYSPTASEFKEQTSGEIKAFGINFNERLLIIQGDTSRDTTVLEALASNGITKEEIDAIPRITKEQFYDLN